MITNYDDPHLNTLWKMASNNKHTNFDLLRKQIEVFAKLSDSDWEMLLPHLQVKKIKKHHFF
jgi:protease II